MTKIYPHTNYVLPRDQLRCALANPTRGRFVFLIGPSGVGKTTARRALMREMCGEPAQWGAGHIPIIEVFALLPHNAFFSSRSLIKSMLQELFIPDLSWLRDGDNSTNDRYNAVKAEVGRSSKELNGLDLPKLSEPDMWEKFQRMAPERGVEWGVIEQAHALCTNRRNKDAADHILNLMSILEKVDMNFLLSGVHGAAELWATRPEVRRRSTVIWMPPYRHERKQDRDPFLTLLRTLGQQYRFSKETLLFDMADELMAASAGIFGVLNKILSDAYSRSQMAGQNAITKSDVVNSYYGETDYRKMWADVKFFQEIMSAANTKTEALQVASAWKLRDKRKAKEPAAKVGEPPEKAA